MTLTNETVNVTIDGVAIAAAPGELIIAAAERAGIFIPRFCYHPHMEPVGMCRMCLVEVSSPRGPSLQPACFVRVAEGQEVLTQSDGARKAQEGVLEFLLVNHPLDCPVCDKGGECPLQDQALSHGPGESRFVEEKRHFEKPITIGPLVALDRERCIQCARCTRFAAEVAGEAQIDFASRGETIEVATFPTEPFDSYFSGNTVQICPVGALTALPYRFKSRPWDLEQVESTCTTCSVGCRVAAQSSAGELVRFLGVDVDALNRSWLCDKGRFSHEAVHATNRLVAPFIRRDEVSSQASWHEAISEVVAGIRWGMERGGAGGVGVIGGARLTNEDAYAWVKLAKSVIGTDNLDAQLGDGLPAELILGLPTATLQDALEADVIVSFAPDLREELPVAYLRVREALAGGATLIECSPVSSPLSSGAIHLTYLPGEAAHLAEALVGEHVLECDNVDADALATARAALERSNARVVVLIGRASLAESAATVAAAASILNAALPSARFLSTLRRANVHGALDMGAAPGLLPGRVALDDGRSWFESHWGSLPEHRGLDTAGMLAAAAAGEITTLIVLGADPLSDFPDRALVRQAFDAVPFLCVLGTHADRSSARAHVVLPVAGDAERVGTTTNFEGRISRLAPKVIAPGVSWPAWMVAAEIARRLDADLGFSSLEDIQAEIAQCAPAHRGLRFEALGDPAWRDGVVIPLVSSSVAIAPRRFDPIATPGITSAEEQGAPLRVGATAEPVEPDDDLALSRPKMLGAPALGEVPVAPRLDAYSLRLVLRRSLYDAGTLVSSSPSLAPLAEAPTAAVHPQELARLGVASGERLRIRSERAACEVVAFADASIARHVVAVGFNSAGVFDDVGVDAAVLIDAGALVTDVYLETI